MKRAELLATGTDDAHAQPRIIPVRTGLEGVSRPGRDGLEVETYCPVDSGDLEDLFADDETPGVGIDVPESDDLECLFKDDDPVEGEPDEGLDWL